MNGRDSGIDEFGETSRYAKGRGGGVSVGVVVLIVVLAMAAAVFGALYVTHAMQPSTTAPLQVREITVTPSKLAPGKTGEVHVLWHGDPEAETSYTTPPGATMEGSGPIARLNPGSLESGTYLLKATVRSHDGRFADAYALFSMSAASHPPAVPTVTQVERRVDCDNSRWRVKLHAESVDPDNDPVRIRWASDQGTPTPPEGADTNISGSLPDGTIQVTVRATATDGTNESQPAQFQFRVGYDANCND